MIKGFEKDWGKLVKGVGKEGRMGRYKVMVRGRKYVGVFMK